MSKHYTKKQHYIPRMILKHHTIPTIPPFSDNRIYQFDKEENIKRIVDIYDICRKNNLYEFRNEDGSIKDSLRNVIENTFSVYERLWNNSINNILEHKKLGDRDHALLYVLVALQILRLPNIQKEVVEACKEVTRNFEKCPTDIEIENWVKLASLPTGLLDDNMQIILNYFISILCKKEIIIRYTDEILAINGDFPVAVYPTNFDCDFPITSHICIQLREKRYYKDYALLSKAEARRFNDYTINICNGRFIYSSIPFDQLLK